MRRVVLLFALVACRTTSNDAPPRPPTPAPAIIASAAPVDAGVAPQSSAPVVEEPLAWGTRPSKEGPFFPVIDGMCVHAEVWPTGGSAVLTYGNGTGPWTRGSTPTFARFVDDGLAFDGGVGKPIDEKKKEEWDEVRPTAMFGTWPSPLFVYSDDGGNGRMRSYDSIWSHEEGGWKQLVSFREDGQPAYGEPFIFRNWLVGTRATQKSGSSDDFDPPTIKTWSLEEGATPIAGISALTSGGFSTRKFMPGQDTIWANGYGPPLPGTAALRVWKDGKISSYPVPKGSMLGVDHDRAVFIDLDLKLVSRVDATGKKTEVSYPQPKTGKSRGIQIAPNGEVWILTDKFTVYVVGETAATETQLPAPAVLLPHEDVQHWPSSGDALAGVDLGDPWAIGAGGSLFHFENGQWSESRLPAPPFAAKGKYQAQALVMKNKGDLFVNAGYAEKGIGWTRVERYRSILRTKRPKEVLRCNEPSGGNIWDSGAGFMSFPPIADESCKTPVAILVRLAWDLNKKTPIWKFDKKSDYPTLRGLMKGMTSLGATVDLVEVVSGDHRYLAAKVPTTAAGTELALAAAKKNLEYETRPEVVCGAPKAERTITVDIATGKVVPSAQ